LHLKQECCKLASMKTAMQLIEEDERKKAERKKAALLRIRDLLPLLGQKLDREVRPLLSDAYQSGTPTFTEMAKDVAKILVPSAKA
jgi:hypothetical protein